MSSPNARRAIAVAVLETELEAMTDGALVPTPRRLAEVKVSLQTLRACHERDVDTALAAIHEVRFDPAAEYAE